MIWFKQNFKIILFVIILLGLFFWHRDVFYIELLAYGFLLYFLHKIKMSERMRHIVSRSIWITLVIILGLTFYVNHWLPHGPLYPTGEYVCQNDDRGPCGEQYREDLRGLHIPSWAKFIRSDWEILSFALIIVGIVVTAKNQKDQE